MTKIKLSRKDFIDLPQRKNETQKEWIRRCRFSFILLQNIKHDSLIGFQISTTLPIEYGLLVKDLKEQLKYNRLMVVNILGPELLEMIL